MSNIFLATAVAIVHKIYWRIFRRRDTHIPPKYWGPTGLALVGSVAGAFVATQLTGSGDLLTSIAGAFIGSQMFNIAKEMVNPQPFPPSGD